MTHSPQPYNTSKIRRLLNLAFDDSELRAFCMDYFPNVYDKFSEGMRRDIKINLLLDHCRRNPTNFDKLLDIMRKNKDDLFTQYEPYIVSDQLVSRTIISRAPVELFAELVEWKLIHNESQILLNVLDIPLGYLTAYRFKPDPERLDDAGYKWQELCVPKLRSVPDKWNLQYAYTYVFYDLQNQISSLDKITRYLMQTDIRKPEFKIVFSQLAELRGILWDVLTAADKRIGAIIEALHPILGE